jgi:hypothetical protein
VADAGDGILFSQALAAEGAVVFAIGWRPRTRISSGRDRCMIKIAVTAEAFAAVEATLPLGTVGVEPKPNEMGEREIWHVRAVRQARPL